METAITSVPIRGRHVQVGSLLVNLDPRVQHNEIKVTGITHDGNYLVVRNTTTGRASRLSVQRVRATYGCSNGYTIRAV